MRVLVFTNMYPTERMPFYGSFVRAEAESLAREGVDVDVYFVNGRASKLNYLGMPLGFFRRMRAGRYDVVHVHHSYCGYIATLQHKTPVVWTFHEGEISSDADIIQRDEAAKRLAYSKGFKRRVARSVDRVIVVSEHLKGPVGREDAITLPSGVDTEKFQPRDRASAVERIGLDPDRRYVLFPSSPDRIEKRYRLAREAVDLLTRDDEFRDVELICLDRIPHENVPDYMNASELMLMTSAFEASPVTIREALACNVPVVSTDIGDARVILESVDGCHVVPAEPEQIAGTVREVLRRGVRVPGREAMEKYSLQNTARELVRIYQSLVEERSS